MKIRLALAGSTGKQYKKRNTEDLDELLKNYTRQILNAIERHTNSESEKLEAELECWTIEPCSAMELRLTWGYVYSELKKNGKHDRCVIQINADMRLKITPA